MGKAHLVAEDGYFSSFISNGVSSELCFLVFTAIAMSFAQLPSGNPALDGAFIGLRCALCGIVVATIAKSWRRIVNGVYGWIAVPLYCALIIGFKVPAGRILVAAIAFGVLVFTLGPCIRSRFEAWKGRPR